MGDRGETERWAPSTPMGGMCSACADSHLLYGRAIQYVCVDRWIDGGPAWPSASDEGLYERDAMRRVKAGAYEGVER